MSEGLARNIGALTGRSGHTDIADVSVGEGAVRRADAVVTSNATAILKIVEAAGARLRIEPVLVVLGRRSRGRIRFAR
jgi:hypothetical protein